LAAITGILRPFEAGGLGLGQSLGAILYAVTGSYSGLLSVALGAHLLAALLLFLVRAPQVPKPANRSSALSTDPLV
jgi:hypothetical protein